MEGSEDIQSKGFDQAMSYCEKQGKKLKTQFRMKDSGFDVEFEITSKE